MPSGEAGVGCGSLWEQGHWCLGPQRMLTCVSSPKRLPFWRQDLAPPNRMQALVRSPSEQTTSRTGIQPQLRANRMPKVVLSSQLTINIPLDMALPTNGIRSKSTHRGQEPVPSTRKPAQTPEPTLHTREQIPEARTTTLQPVETCRQGKKQQLELDTEQRTDSKLGKEYIKDVYCHPAI